MKRITPLIFIFLVASCTILALCGCVISGKHGKGIPLCNPFQGVFTNEPVAFGTNSLYLACCLNAKLESDVFYSFEQGFSIVRHGNFRFDDQEMLHPRPLDMAYAWSRLSGSDDCFRDELQNFRSFNSLSETQSLAASAIQVILPDEGYGQCWVFFNTLPIATIKDGRILFDEKPPIELARHIQDVLGDRGRDDFMIHWKYINPLIRNSGDYFHADLAVRHFAKPQTMIPPGNYLVLDVEGHDGIAWVEPVFIHVDSFSVAFHYDSPSTFLRKQVWCYLYPDLFPEHDDSSFFPTNPEKFIPGTIDYIPPETPSSFNLEPLDLIGIEP